MSVDVLLTVLCVRERRRGDGGGLLPVRAASLRARREHRGPDQGARHGTRPAGHRGHGALRPLHDPVLRLLCPRPGGPGGEGYDGTQSGHVSPVMPNK